MVRPGAPSAGRRDGAPAMSLREARRALVESATGVAAIRDLPAAYGRAVDTYLVQLLDSATGGDPAGLALLAVGSYGRGELAPGSDLDLVLVHRGGRGVGPVAETIWYAIWDQGVRLDHSVRTVREAVALARTDLKVMLGLLDARVVAGDAPVAARLVGGDGEPRGVFRAHARRYLTELGASVDERRRLSGEVPFLLEPDLKESRGGLRDVVALRAAALAVPALAGSIRPAELDAPAGLLLQARVALHVVTGRALDRLLLQEQDAVAGVLGYPDADALMAAVAAAGREVARSSDLGWRRIRSWCAGPAGKDRARDRPLAPGVVLRDGEIALAPDADVAGDPVLLLRLAAAAADLDLPMAPPALDRLVSAAAPMPEPWPHDMRQLFLAVLGSGERGVRVLEALDQRRLVERLMPEWSAVRSLPQRNAYHRFTVDRHLLETAAQAARRVRDVARPDLLLVSALLHDIGKGFPGDHTRAGMAVVPAVAGRMGLAAGDVEVIVRLVEHHLLLADVATRRDLDDPSTIGAVAGALRDRATVELLAALTEADSRATGPAAWGTWKARLVGELAARTIALLGGPRADDGGRADDGRADAGPGPAFPAAWHLELMRAGVLRLVASGERGNLVVTVAAADRPGLLSIVAGVLTLNGLEVRSANAAGGVPGMAVERFEVEPAFATVPDWAKVESDLAGALDGRLLLEARLADQARAYLAGRRPTTARPAPVRVLVDNDASATSTVVEVRAPDSHGLLHRVTRALAAAGLDVVAARVSTLGHEVVDSFYVRRTAASDGRCKIDDPAGVEQLERSLVAAARAPDGEQTGDPG